MHILLLTQIVPYPPDSGPKIKTYRVLRYLAEHGHHVTLASFVREEEEKHLADLKPFCAGIHAVPMRRSPVADVWAYALSVFRAHSFLVTRDAKAEMFALVRRLVRAQSFDIIHADQLTMAQFALQFRNSQFATRNSPGLVFDAHNAVWQIVERARQTAPLFVRPFVAQEARRLKVYEGQLCRAMDAVLAVSRVDKRALVEAGADARKISVIPIAVDCEALKPLAAVGGQQPALSAVEGSAAPANIVTVGTLFYPPNADGVRWFVREVYPLVRAQVPASSLTIVGPRPPKDIVQYATRNAQFATVTGYVSDLNPYLERAAVMVVPVRAASGMRVRILEALARGVPIVTTTTGVEGIDAVHGEHLLVADEPQPFAAEVARLLCDDALRQRLAINGRRLIEEKYDWRVVLPKLEEVHKSLCCQPVEKVVSLSMKTDPIARRARS